MTWESPTVTLTRLQFYMQVELSRRQREMNSFKMRCIRILKFSWQVRQPRLALLNRCLPAQETSQVSRLYRRVASFTQDVTKSRMIARSRSLGLSPLTKEDTCDVLTGSKRSQLFGREGTLLQKTQEADSQECDLFSRRV